MKPLFLSLVVATALANAQTENLGSYAGDENNIFGEYVYNPGPTTSVIDVPDNHNFQLYVDGIPSVPEPSSVALLASGSLLFLRRKRF
jgi:hypothetical protein